MGLHKQYFKVGQNARNQLFGFSRGANQSGSTPLSMLISQGINLNNNRVAVIIFGIVTLIAGIILSSIPWLDYFILKNLRLWNNTLSFHYWQRPGVIRLTKVYIFNVTNPDGFLNGEKPKLTEVGPFVYREDMEKVNIKFHDNFTVTYQHKKILEFVPEMSIDKNTPIVTPNIPLLTFTTQAKDLGFFVTKAISVAVTASGLQPFVSVTADDLVFGYDDALVTLAHNFYPRDKRPMSKMGLLIGRNGTLTEYSTIHTGHSGMEKFGYLDRLNGLDHFPYWKERPCTDITGSEGSFFPPRDYTKSDTVYIYDKDLCRIIPLEYVKPVVKDGIDADYYTIPETAYGNTDNNKSNSCYDTDEYAAVKGLQNISPCQYGAPVYISNPHFYQSDKSLLEACEGLSPNKEAHNSYFKIQPKIGVPLEGKVRVQLNLKVDRSENIQSVKDFRDFVFPIMWLEEGIADLTPEIRRWIYLGTVFAPTAIPILSYGMIISGAFILIFIFVKAYQKFIFQTDPTQEILEMGRRTLRRGSSFIMHHQRFMMHRESYTLLKNGSDNNNSKIISNSISNNKIISNSDSNNNFNNSNNKINSVSSVSTSSSSNSSSESDSKNSYTCDTS